MRSRARRIGVTSKSLVYAIVIHLAAGVLLVLNIDWPSHVVSSPRSEPAPVQASVVSEAEIQKQMEAIQQKEQAEKRKQQEAEQKLEELLQKKKEEQQRLAEIKERQKQEKERAEELAKKREQEKQELAKLKQQEQQQREQEEAERRRREEAERKRKEEAERKRREEEKRKAEAERKRREAEQQRQKELAAKRQREEELQEQLERERLQRRVQSALARYIPIIRQKVSRNWNHPATIRNDIEAHVTVRLSQSGEVISARIVKSSGNPVFDRSVENAVLKASPLPIPRERGVNEQFRTLRLKFKPEDMIS